MDLNFLHQLDVVTLNLEKARRDLEVAKAAFENAKQEHDAILGKSEEVGMSRAKVRKLAEDRVLALFESGLLGTSSTNPQAVKPVKAKKPKRDKALDDTEMHIVDDIEAPAELHS